MRRAARKDNAQEPVIQALEAAGATVEIIKQPLDLLVGYRRSWGILEVKSSQYQANVNTPTRKRQKAFAERHPQGGPIGTCWDVDGALTFLKVMSSDRSNNPIESTVSPIA